MNRNEFFRSSSGTVRILRCTKYPSLVGKVGTVVHVTRFYLVVRIPGNTNYHSHYGGYSFKWGDLELLPLTIRQMELAKTFKRLEKKIWSR